MKNVSENTQIAINQVNQLNADLMFLIGQPVRVRSNRRIDVVESVSGAVYGLVSLANVRNPQEHMGYNFHVRDLDLVTFTPISPKGISKNG